MKKLVLVVLAFISLSGIKANEDYVAKLAKHQASAFVENKGQLNFNHKDMEKVFFYMNAMPFSMYITDQGLSYYFQKITTVNTVPLTGDNSILVKEKVRKFERMDLILEGATILKENIFASEEKANVNHYYIGNNSNPIRDVKLYQKVLIKSIYKGIDWVIYISEKENKAIIKQDFIIHPFANPSDIKLVYRGAAKASLINGQVHVESIYGNFTEGDVFSYQNKLKVTSGYKQLAKDDNSLTLGFEVGDYDKSQLMTIDPPLTWCTYFGAGDLDGSNAIEVDKKGNVFISGYGNSPDLPVTNPGGGAYYNETIGSGIIMWSFVVKFNANSELIWATYIGGNRYDYLRNCEVDAFDNIWLSGFTQGGGNFPLLNPGAGAYFRSEGSGGEGILMKFNSNAELVYSTLVGGGGGDDVRCMAGDEVGDIYIITNGSSSNMPLQNPGIGNYHQNSAGGSNDIHLMRLNRRGVLLNATYIGGSGSDNALDIEIDHDHNVYITGSTSSSNFPKNNGATGYSQGFAGSVSTDQFGLLGGDVFVVQLNKYDGLEWTTYLGGSQNEEGRGIDIDQAGNFYVAGATSSVNFPTMEHEGNCGFYQSVKNQGDDMFITKFNSKRELVWSTFVGGDGNDRGWDVRLDKNDNLFFVGETSSVLMPTTDPGDGSYYQGGYSEGFFIRPGGTVVPSNDVFIMQFNSSAIVRYGTFYGSAGNDWPRSMIDDTTGRIYITGEFLGDGVSTLDRGNNAYYQGNHTASDDAFIMMFEVQAMEDVFRVTVSEDAFICTGGSTVLSAFGAETYEWTPSTGLDRSDSNVVIAAPAATTTYTVKGINAENCFIYKTVTVHVVNKVQPIASPDVEICIGDKAKIYAEGANSFSWSPTTGLDNPNSASPNASPLQTTTYIVSANAAGCSEIGRDTVKVTVIQLPKASFTYDKDSFEVSFNGPTSNGIFKWLWDFDDRSPLSTSKNPLHIYGQTDTFNVKLKVWNECGVDSLIFPVIINGESGSGETGLNINPLNELAIYPNPFQDYILINNVQVSAMKVRVYDMLGRKQEVSMEENSRNYYINTRSLSKGLYLIVVETGENRIVKKIQKN